MKKLSVIIPFHDDLGGLQQCLQALGKQTYPADAFEVVAIDNGSTENVTKIKGEFPQVRWLTEAEPGSYCARNRGVREARGEIIAFTDADCRPSPTWLQAAVAAFENTQATVIGGKIEYLDPPNRALNIYELFEIEFFRLAKQQDMIEHAGVAATANLVACRSVFDRIGFFDPDLKSLGDGEWTRRASAKGEVLRYADTVVVSHPRRSTFSAILRKVRRIAGGRIILMEKQKEPIAKLVSEVCRYSFLNPRMHRYALSFPGVEGTGPRVRIFFFVEFLSWVNPVERLRVLLGGKAYRG